MVDSVSLPALLSPSLNRRLFLKRAAMLSAASAVAPSLLQAETLAKDSLLGGGRYQSSESGATEYVLSLVNPHSADIQRIPSTFFPHGFAFSPSRSSLVYAFEKIGPGAAVFDLDSRSMVQEIAPVKGRQFYGHGACTRDDRYLFSTETSADGKGAIGIRDPRSLDYLGDFPTYGDNPHECRLIEHDTVLMVTNGGGTRDSGRRGSLTYIDVRTQQLLERIDMPDERFNTGHLYPLPERKAVVVSAPRLGLDKRYPGAVSLNTGGDTLKVISQPASVVSMMYGEALSVEVVEERDLFIVTHPTPGMLTFWSLSGMDYRGHLMVENARGVAISADRKCLWISCGRQANIRALNLETLKMEEAVDIAASYITGSHLTNLAMLS